MGPDLTKGQKMTNRIKEAAAFLAEIGGRIGATCVKNDDGRYGLAVDLGKGEHPIEIYPRGEERETERHASWTGAAEAGWTVD